MKFCNFLLLLTMGYALITPINAQDSSSIDSNLLILTNEPQSSSVKDHSQDVNFELFLKSYQGFLGALVGSFLAALIAFYSIRITHKKQLDVENKKNQWKEDADEKDFCGILFAIQCTLKHHRILSKSLEEELDTIIEANLERESIYDQETYIRYNTDFLTDCALELIKYQLYNPNIIYNIISYIDGCQTFERANNISKIKYQFDKNKDQENYTKQFSIAISKIKEVIEDVKKLNNLTTKSISEYLKESKSNNIFYNVLDD